MQYYKPAFQTDSELDSLEKEKVLKKIKDNITKKHEDVLEKFDDFLKEDDIHSKLLVHDYETPYEEVKEEYWSKYFKPMLTSLEHHKYKVYLQYILL